MKKRFEDTILVRAEHLMDEFTQQGKLAKKMSNNGASEDELHIVHMNMADLAEELLHLDSYLRDYQMEWIDDDRVRTLWRALVSYKKQQG